MTIWGTALHEDQNGIKTSGAYGDRGDGVNDWFQWIKATDGGLITVGAKADAAVSGGATAGSVIALLKGLQVAQGISTDAVALAGNGNAIQLLKAIRDLQGPGSNAVTTVYATSLVVKASAGTLLGFQGYNSAIVAQFIQVHDAASLPANGVAPKIMFTVPPSSNFSLDFGSLGRSFTTGIVICNSSTGPTKTVGSADIWVDAQYR